MKLAVHSVADNGWIDSYSTDQQDKLWMVILNQCEPVHCSQGRWDSFSLLESWKRKYGVRNLENGSSALKRTYLYLRNRLDTETNHAGETTGFTYFLNDALKSKQLPKGNTWVYRYDNANRLYQITAPADENGQQGVTTFLYDNNDNLISQQDAEQKVTTFDYDALNRQMLSTFARPANSVGIDIESVRTRYDGNNNMRSVTEHYYDSAINDRITQYVYDNFDRLQTKIDSFGQSTEFGYDLNGVRTRITDADKLTTKFIPDELNRISKVINTQGTTQYQYYRDSRLKSVSYPNSISSQYTYDTAGRVDTITNNQNSALVSSYDYGYDVNGNRTQQIEINGAAAETTTYDYDGLDRLTRVIYPDQTVTYTYDLAYNRKTETTADLTATTIKNWQYQYNDRHQLTDIQDQLDAAQSISYGYDNNGNQISKTKGTDITHFVFDARDDLRQVQVGGSTAGQFLYDANGLRIEKSGDRGIERYTYDDLSVLRQFDENNQTLAKFDYGPDRLLSLSHTAEGTQFYLMDALNSVVNLANANGAVQARYQYDAWGNKGKETGNSWNRFGFTGHEHDTESGLLYAKARFYDPETGRFLGQDAWEGDTQLPPSLHKYLYAYQNPTVYWDPDGNETIKEMMGTDDASVDDAIAAGRTSTWDAVAYAGKQTFYSAWNFASLGFLERQDDRRYKYDRNQISESEFNGSTFADAGVTALAAAAGGGVASRVTAKLGGGTAATLTGAGAGGAFDNATVQAGQVLTHQATDGRIGQESINATDAALAGTVGIVMKGVSLKSTPKVTVENTTGPNAKAGDSWVARADAEAGMPSSHPIKPQTVRARIEANVAASKAAREAAGNGFKRSGVGSVRIKESGQIQILKGNARGGNYRSWQNIGDDPVTRLRNNFDSFARKDFIKQWASSDQASRILSSAEQAFALKRGLLPKGWNVHHKKPLSRGGDNSFENLRVIRSSLHQKLSKRLHNYEEGNNPYGLD